MEGLVESYVDYLRSEKNASENTTKSYEGDLRKFIVSLKEKGIESVGVVRGDVVSQYMITMQQEGRAASSVSRSLASIRSFYQFLIKNKVADEDPTENIKSLKVEKKVPEALAPEEIDRLLSQPKDTDAKGARDKAMLELLYATGMRVSEMISLDLEDVHLEEGYITCRAERNGRDRDIPLYEAAKDAVALYIDRARIELNDIPEERALFVNCNGGRLTRQGFWKIIKHYKEVAKIDKEITPKTLRHSFAIHLLENGADFESVREMLGHREIASTQVYINAVKNKRMLVYSNAHPKAKQRKKKD